MEVTVGLYWSPQLLDYLDVDFNWPQHHLASQHPGAECGHGTGPGAISDTRFSSRWHRCSVVLVPGCGESATMSSAGHHLSMAKTFPVMPSGWAALMVKTYIWVYLLARHIWEVGINPTYM